MPKAHMLILVFLVLCFNTPLLECFLVNQTNVNKVEIARNLYKLKDVLAELTSPYIKISIAEIPPNCVQMQCKYVCFNGKSEEIAKDINQVAETSKIVCPILEELRLYNYAFPNNKIQQGFLQEYTSRVESIYIGSANVTDIEDGAFTNGIFRDITLENLKLRDLHTGFFNGISTNFEALTVIQKESNLSEVCANFLDKVKYQIKSLTLQVGIECVRNLTASSYLLNNLAYVDFSYNNFADSFTASTFNRLSMVEHLDLSHSHISYLPEYIFMDFITTLEYLDLSYNNLLTVTRTIFGWRELPRDLKIYLNDNPWHCSCDLATELKDILLYQSSHLYCERPAEYAGWSVYDDRLCSYSTLADSTSSTYKTSTTTMIKPPGIGTDESILESDLPYITTYTTKVTAATHTTTKPMEDIEEDYGSGMGGGGGGGGGDNSDIVELTCKGSSNIKADYTQQQSMKWPTVEFDLVTYSNERVDVIVVAQSFDEKLGLFWFSKVSMQYYQMEVNHKEYGIGCYRGITHHQTVNDLEPNESYTFCVVEKDQLRVSPFNCKSIHISGNLGITYSAWLTHDERTKFVSLVIFGIVLFVFLGITMVFLVLKQKPTLLKGSKRVAQTKGNTGEIIVFPKDKTLQDFVYKEEMLAKRYSKSTISCMERRNSTHSIDSYQSYMNANLYEVIPAYLKLHDATLQYNLNESIANSYYMPDLSQNGTANLVSYAEIPYRTKRTSNDPLPEVPQDQAPLSMPLSECLDALPAESLDYAFNMDSQIKF